MNTKSGFQTSEFTATIAGVLATLLLSFGIISQPQFDLTVKIIENVGVIAISFFTIYKLAKTYVDGRNSLKLAQIGKLTDAAVITTQTVAETLTPIVNTQPLEAQPAK